MNQYKLHRDDNINSLLSAMAVRNDSESVLKDIKEERLNQNNSIIKANILEKDSFVQDVMLSEGMARKRIVKDLSEDTKHMGVFLALSRRNEID
jgi:hypothetical protein